MEAEGNVGTDIDTGPGDTLFSPPTGGTTTWTTTRAVTSIADVLLALTIWAENFFTFFVNLFADTRVGTDAWGVVWDRVLFVGDTRATDAGVAELVAGYFTFTTVRLD